MILSVASGKGGTGKTLVATSLALSLEGQGAVQLLDCDVEEPNAHILLRPQIDSSQPGHSAGTRGRQGEVHLLRALLGSVRVQRHRRGGPHRPRFP